VTDETTHSDTATTEEHVTDTHGLASHVDESGHGGDDPGHGGDDHGHGGEALGPIDWGRWAFAVAGAIGALIVLAFFFVALGGIPA